MLFIFSCLREEARILFKSIFLLTLIQHKKVTQLSIKYFPFLHAVFSADGCFLIFLPDSCGRNKPIISHFVEQSLVFLENLKWVFLSSKPLTEQKKVLQAWLWGSTRVRQSDLTTLSLRFKERCLLLTRISGGKRPLNCSSVVRSAAVKRPRRSSLGRLCQTCRWVMSVIQTSGF